MKKSKTTTKLLAAIAGLGLAVASTVGSTYAWFSMNSTVTATGMNVTVEAPTSLLISTTNATTGFGATVALENDTTDAATKFAPVTYADVCANWYKLTDEAMAKVDENGRINGVSELADGSATASFTATKIGTDDVYVSATDNVYHDTIWLKLEGDQTGTKDVTVAAAYTAQPSEAIKNAMHVVFVVENAVKGTIDMGSLSTPQILTLTANAAAKQVDIYYFLSGNDEDCKNVNITGDASMSVNLTFSIPQD